MARYVKPIPVSVISSAINGDAEALAIVVAHYQNYIRALATKYIHDEHGNEFWFVDEGIRLRLESKLIYSIATGFVILPV